MRVRKLSDDTKYIFIVKFLDGGKNHRLGAEWQRVIRDLKTLRGVENRIVRGVIPPGAVGCDIYRVASDHFYNEEKHRLVQKMYFN